MRSARLLWVALAAALAAAAAAIPRHEEAPVVSVNGTFNTHFTARIEGLEAGSCILFEAQARVPQKRGELCIAEAGVKLSGAMAEGAHPLDVDRLLPKGCGMKGLRIAEVVADDPTDCFLHKAQQLDVAVKVREECDPKSPFSYQFIDPTRHRVTYGGPKKHPIADLCTQLMEELPEQGLVEHMATSATLGRSSHSAFTGKCLKSATYVVVNPCNGTIAAMLLEGGNSGAHGGVIGALAETVAGLAVLLVIAGAAATAFLLLYGKRRAAAQQLEFYEISELTRGMPDSLLDSERQ